MQNVKIVKGIVGRCSQDNVVAASVYGSECERLVNLGVIVRTNEPATHDANGDPLPEAPPKAVIDPEPAQVADEPEQPIPADGPKPSNPRRK